MDESSRSFIVKREKSKKQGKGSQAFFSRNLNFFEVFCASDRR